MDHLTLIHSSSNNITQNIQNLPILQSKMMAEYIWIGGNDNDLHSKTRVFDFKINDLIADLPKIPVWNYDGSSCNQASGHFSEILIKPVRLFRDPFRYQHKGDDNEI
jgi:glutamine synthetase